MQTTYKLERGISLNERCLICRSVLDRRQEYISVDWRRNSIQVQISKLTILAVVTRLITDRFHVTPKGCVVKSSVCHDVTIEFPEGAVDKTMEGTMKVN